MTLLTPTAIGYGTLLTPVAVSASDTVSATGGSAYILEVINGGGSPDTVVIVDPGTTPAGNSATNAGVAVAAGARRHFRLDDYDVNPTTQLITITHSFTTSVTCNLFRT
jgi:hypothetical protein